MTTIIRNAKRWRDRAKEARSLAAQIDNSVNKLAMLTIAESYDHIAERAAARALESEPKQTGNEFIQSGFRIDVHNGDIIVWSANPGFIAVYYSRRISPNSSSDTTREPMTPRF